MDIQLYFDQVVYTEMEYLLEQYRLGNINKELVTNVVSVMCNVGEISTVGKVADVMGTDAMSWFLDQLDKSER